MDPSTKPPEGIKLKKRRTLKGGTRALYGPFEFTSDGSAPKTWSIIDGALPTGITLSAAGFISGTPSEYGDFTFEVQVSNAGGVASAVFNLTINKTPEITPITAPDISQNKPYNVTFEAIGHPAITWDISAGALPSGLFLNPATGEISGFTSDALGVVNFTVRATNTAGSDTLAASPEIVAGAAIVRPLPAIPIALRDEVYALPGPIEATGSTPITWAIDSGDLPPGLLISPSGTGDELEILGTPTDNVPRIYPFVLKAFNVNGEDLEPIAIELQVKPELTTANPLNLFKELAITPIQLEALGNQPITFDLDSGSFPAGVSMSPGTGIISGTPTTVESTTARIKMENVAGIVFVDLDLIVSPIPASITTGTVPNVFQGFDISPTFQFEASGSTPFTFEVTAGALPYGVEITPTGLMQGRPLNAGTFVFTLTVDNEANTPFDKEFTLTSVAGETLPVILTENADITVAQSNFEYSFQVVSAGTEPITHALYSGSLPGPLTVTNPAPKTVARGISISSSGLISGRSVQGAGNYVFTISATNSVGTVTKQFTLTMVDVPPSNLRIEMDHIGLQSDEVPAPGVTEFRDFQTATIVDRLRLIADGSPGHSIQVVSGAYPPQYGELGLGEPFDFGVRDVGEIFSLIGGQVYQSVAIGHYLVTVKITNSAGESETIDLDLHIVESTTGSPVPRYLTPEDLDLSTEGPILLNVFYSLQIQLNEEVYGKAHSWYLARVNPLVPGSLTLNPVTGVLSGTVTDPALLGRYDGAWFNPPAALEIEARSLGRGSRNTPAFSVTVTDSPAILTGLAGPNLGVTWRPGQPVSFQLLGNGVGTLIWSLVSGALPANLSMNANGLITGTVATGTAALYSFRVRLQDDLNDLERDLQVNVVATPFIAEGVIFEDGKNHIHPHAVVGTPYTHQIQVWGEPPIDVSLSSGPLLSTGLSLSLSGNLSGTPTATLGGGANDLIRATNASGFIEKLFRSVILGPPVFKFAGGVISGTSSKPLGNFVFLFENLEDTSEGEVVQLTIQSGSLPPGLSFSGPGNKTLSGIPTADGSYPLTVRATNAFGFTDLAISLEIAVPDPLSLSNVLSRNGGPSNGNIFFLKGDGNFNGFQVYGGVGDPDNYVYEFVGAPLPPELGFLNLRPTSPTGWWQMHGTPNQEAPSYLYVVTVRVTDEGTNSYERDYTIYVTFW